MSFGARLRAEISAAPITVASYMARCNAHYYASRDPLGASGDFTTAPEISQMFGELVGAWIADQWHRVGSPIASQLVELGPGRGTMMADMLRSIAAANWYPDMVFIETSPELAAAQARAVPGAQVRASLAEVADGAPLFIVANEFFDALPVRQFERSSTGWHERLVATGADSLLFALGEVDAASPIPSALAAAPIGSVVELSPTSTAIAAEVGIRLRAHGGAALIIDYGHAGPVTGDTLQAVRNHTVADPLAEPGEADLTAHVDFTALAVAANANSQDDATHELHAWGPIGQGAFLRALGIDYRATTLKRTATPAQAAAIDAAVARLTGDDAMGSLFKVMALTTTGTVPPGFA